VQRIQSFGSQVYANGFFKMKKLLPLIVLTIGFLSAKAQMTTDNTLTVQQYVQDVLLGQNVTVSNITFNGGNANAVSTAVGGFECVDCNLGIESGFAMSSGDVAGMIGPNNSTGYTGTGTGGFSGSDPDLLDLVQANGGNSINDWVIIEFDFIPLGDTIQFQYVWGSEEYDTYVGSGFNDVFGFFLSGPGITGPFSNNAENIAIVPGTTSTGVAINTINNGNGNAGPCSNCDYYNQLGNDNDFFNNSTDDIYTNPFYMQFDGYTDVLTAVAIVQCGQTYHIKLAVSDANDGALDSGVFLQRDSFSSNLVVQATLDLAVAGPDENTLFENCGDGYITFARPESGNPDIELVAHLEYSGTAINGVDYTLMPDSVVFAPGQMTISLYLDGFADGINEGIETVHMEITNIADCGEAPVSSSFDFFVSDVAEPLVVDGFDINICSGGTATLEPIITGGYAVYHYDWSTGETSSSIDVTPPLTTTYFLTVSDTCGMPSDDAQFIVTVLATPILLVDIVDQDQILPMNCNSWGTLYANAQGGINPYTYSWSDDQGNNLWGWDNTVSVSPWNAGMVYVEVEDECGFTAQDSIEIIVNAPQLFLNVPATVNAPCGQNFTVTAVATGGETQGWGYSFSWMVDGVPDWNQWTDTYSGVANNPSTLTVTASDQCGQSLSADVEVTIDSPAITLTVPTDIEGNCATILTINPELSGGSGSQGSWTYLWTSGGSTLGTDNSYSSTYSQDTQVDLTVTDVCGQTATGSTNVNVVNPAVTVTLGDDINASCIDNTQLTASVSGGSGGLSYQWIVNGAVVSSLPSYVIQSYVTVDVDVVVQDFCGEGSADQVTIIIPDVPVTITASADTAICPGNSVDLWVNAQGGEGGFSYLWNSSIFGNLVNVAPEFTSGYHVQVTDICGRVAEEDVVIEVNPIQAFFSAENQGENLYTFTSTPSPECNGCFTYWNFGDGSMSYEANPEHQFDGLDTYTVQLTMQNSTGCANTQSFTVIPPPYFYIPNAFSPNGDGLNDVFKVEAHAALEYELHIFNRWGMEVFKSTDPEEVWLGNSNTGDYYIPTDVYNYSIRIKGFNSETYKSIGNIQIIR
jgi:gliding motility-associated-like protein